jgi:RNA polymerase sigma-70 factor (ECF subfamily)
METIRRNNDLDLINRIRLDDAAAFEELIQRYSVKVYSLAHRVTKSREDAEDVMQEVFVTLVRKLKAFRGTSTFSSWLYRVTFNCSLMRLRKKKQDQSLPMEEVMAQALSVPMRPSALADEGESSQMRKELRDAITKAISSLPAEYRPVFILRDIDGFTSIEVSEMLRLSVPAVKSRLHRSRLMLQRQLGPLFEEFVQSSAVDKLAV